MADPALNPPATALGLTPAAEMAAPAAPAGAPAPGTGPALGPTLGLGGMGIQADGAPPVSMPGGAVKADDGVLPKVKVAWSTGARGLR